MRTFSHAVITAAIGKRASVAPRGNLVAFLIGSVLPDVPLFILTGLTMLRSPTWNEGMARMHRAFETDTTWIALHNTPHSLVVLGAVALVGGALAKRRAGRRLLWFAAGATLHVIIDIVTHATDGPKFLFPLSWTVRFESPVSYWDPAHFGGAFTVVEYALDALLLGYLVLARRHRRREREVEPEGGV